jgi:VanZ family protein
MGESAGARGPDRAAARKGREPPGPGSGPCDDPRPAINKAVLYAADMSTPAPQPPTEPTPAPLPAAVNVLLYGAAFACVLTIVALSLLPAQEMPSTGIADGIDHLIAYWGTGGLMALAFRGRGRVLVVAGLGLIGLGGLMEVLQQLSPGRTSTWGDFLMSGGGALAGLAMGTVAARLISHLRRRAAGRWGRRHRPEGPVPQEAAPVRAARR